MFYRYIDAAVVCFVALLTKLSKYSVTSLGWYGSCTIRRACRKDEKIYKNEKIQPTIRYFKVVMNEIFYTLKREYNGTATNKSIRKMKRYYPILANEFSNWLEKYSNCQDRDETKYFNKVIYDLNNIQDYCRAIIDYMSGMTDQYIISVYDEIVKF